MAALTPDLEQIRQDGDTSYPRELLDGCGDALLLFAAGFLGRQDGIWIADAGLTAVCVDVRASLLHEMAAVYPADWQFVCADIYQLIDRGELPPADLVSVDCPSGHFQRCADLLDKLCALARRYLVLGCGCDTEVFPPGGWTLLERRYRSPFAGGTYWAILQKDEA